MTTLTCPVLVICETQCNLRGQTGIALIPSDHNASGPSGLVSKARAPSHNPYVLLLPFSAEIILSR